MAQKRSLGISTVNCAPRESKGLQSTQKNTDYDANEHLLNKYALHSAASNMLYDSTKEKQHRITKCLTDVRGEVEVHKSKEHNACHYGGLIVCGNAWGCPICAPKVSEKRRFEIQTAVTAHRAAGGKVLLVTKTFSHTRNDVLKDMIEKISKANHGFFITKAIRKLKAEIKFQGYIRTLEITHSEANGWHPHYHELWFIRSDEDEQALCESVRSRIYPHWAGYVVKHGLGEPSEEYGIDVRNGDFAAEYVAKYGRERTNSTWSVEQELTKTHIKKSKGDSKNTFDFIRDYLETKNQRSLMLYREFMAATHRKRQLSWSRNLKSSFGILEKSDEELAEEQEEHATLLGLISFKHWRLILKNKGRGVVLVLAKNGGWPAVQTYIKGLSAAPT